MKIKSLKGTEILDSRGNPTLRVQIELRNGIKDYAEVPSGASKGTYEALELRDNDIKRYNGLGVKKACANVDRIFDEISQIDVESQSDIDIAIKQLDKTDNKSNLGANACLGVSIACLKVAAKQKNMQYFEYTNEIFKKYFDKDTSINIPTPLFNIINGGAHANDGLDIQEFMIIPHKYGNLRTQEMTDIPIREKVRIGSEVLHSLIKILPQNAGVGDEGGEMPFLKDTKQALNMLCEAIEGAGYKLYDEISLGLDCASNFYFNRNKNKYILDSRNKSGEKEDILNLDRDDVLEYYQYFLDHYPLIYIEDYLMEDDFEGFSMLKNKNGQKDIAFCGDDLTVTNPKRLELAIKNKSINTVIVKPNQIGTIYETLQVVNICLENNIVYVLSHRSGETNDSIIADLAVGLGSKFIKAGSPQRGERISKYNRLMEIGDMIL